MELLGHLHIICETLVNWIQVLQSSAYDTQDYRFQSLYVYKKYAHGQKNNYSPTENKINKSLPTKTFPEKIKRSLT